MPKKDNTTARVVRPKFGDPTPAVYAPDSPVARFKNPKKFTALVPVEVISGLDEVVSVVAGKGHGPLSIRHGDRVLFLRTDDIRRGDIVVFVRAGRWHIRPFLSRRGGRIHLEGLAAEAGGTFTLRPDDILYGRALLVERGGEKVRRYRRIQRPAARANVVDLSCWIQSHPRPVRNLLFAEKGGEGDA